MISFFGFIFYVFLKFTHEIQWRKISVHTGKWLDMDSTILSKRFLNEKKLRNFHWKLAMSLLIFSHTRFCFGSVSKRLRIMKTWIIPTQTIVRMIKTEKRFTRELFISAKLRSLASKLLSMSWSCRALPMRFFTFWMMSWMSWTFIS